MMSRRRSQARRMPISRVRSEIVASMMLMIPIPPTRSEMLAIDPNTRLKMALGRLRPFPGVPAVR